MTILICYFVHQQSRESPFLKILYTFCHYS